MSNTINFFIRTKPLDDEDEGRFEKVWNAQWEENQYKTARDGDHLITPFECDRCIFVKLKKRLPIPGDESDEKLFACIRRINIDAFWSRSSSTVSNNLRNTKRILRFSAELGLPGPFKSYGPMPVGDHCGYEVAATMVMYSTRSGKHSKDHLQFDTIRHLRSCYGNFERISSVNIRSSLTISNQKGGQGEIHQSLTGSIWFKRFFAGCRSRMGQIHKPNLGLSTSLIISLLRKLGQEIEQADIEEDKFELVIFRSYIVISYVLSLRRSEGLMTNLTGISKELTRNRDHCLIFLKGKVKGETSE